MAAATSDMPIDQSIARADTLFRIIAERSADSPGVTRAPYGPSEQMAHDVLAGEARALGLEVVIDAALNLRITLPGHDRAAPAIFVGSHLDSVPHGGNFDGLAGVIAGLAGLERLAGEGTQLRRDVTVMALRGEENAWFGAQHVGSRAALGRLSGEALDRTRRIDSGRSLADHMLEAGADLEPIRAGQALLDKSKIGAFLEVHIEQGPQLVRQGFPIGVVTGIRGALRCRDAVCLGEYGHSGTVGRADRHDAVTAVAELAVGIDQAWADLEAAGGDLVATIGVLSTNPAAHGVTVIPGEAKFSVDVRSHDEATLNAFWETIRTMANAIAVRRGVTFNFSSLLLDPPATMNERLRRLIIDTAVATGIRAVDIASGAGHDAGDFAHFGVPTAMIFVRNRNGSHNSDEAMEMADFAEAVELLTQTIRILAQE